MKLRLSFILVLLLVGIGTFAIVPGVVFAGAAKVLVCHIPPGNPENFHTIKIGEKALDAHLAHGDMAGACNAFCAELCDDGNACTTDDVGDCDHGCPAADPVDCDDGTLCTDDSCDPASGCINAPVCADDGDACTVDACDPATGFCSAPPVACDFGDECDPSSGQCVNAPCVDILLHCSSGSSVLETYCGFGTHALTASDAANISYVIFNGPTSSVVLNHCVDGSAFSGDTLEVFSDTNLCDLPGGASGDPRWNDEVCSVEIK